MAKTSKQTRQHRKLLAIARYWHFNALLVVSEKGKRWMSILAHLEWKFDFNLDDYDNDSAWIKIRTVINQLDVEDVQKLLNY